MNVSGLNEQIASYSTNAVIIGTILLFFLTLLSLRIKKMHKALKIVLFSTISGTVLIVTCFLGASTIFLNTISASSGPVHWHADFEIWNCGKEVDVKDPVGFSNKIGTPILHEHNDKRIHLEGVVVHKEDASLGRFFTVVGGDITPISFSVPTNNGILTRTSGDKCPSNVSAFLQVFVYTVKDRLYSQQKLLYPQNYIISPQGNVPPADCIIIEFDEPKAQTDKLCRSYKVAEQLGKIRHQ